MARLLCSATTVERWATTSEIAGNYMATKVVKARVATKS